ncbi:MAG: 30S ribosomal protein S9 [Anaerolineae bacterium]
MDIPTLVEGKEFYSGVGRRKTASAQVRLYATGEGQIVVNGKPMEEYFTRMRDRVHVVEPLQATGTDEAFTITILVQGGGVTGQAGAVRHGIARALLKHDDKLRPTLRRGGFLTRDPRMKERKKPGLKRARKAPQYTKR